MSRSNHNYHPQHHHSRGQTFPNPQSYADGDEAEDYLSPRGELEGERYEYLRYLPKEGTTVCAYSGPQAMKDTLFNSKTDQNIVFTDIPYSEFKKVESELPRLVDYNRELEILIINMPGLPHELVKVQVEWQIHTKAERMQVCRLLRGLGSTRQETPGRAKEADTSWAPRLLLDKRSMEWPTVALEVGYTETSAKLERDMAFWLNESNNVVNMALSIDIKRSGNLYITAWQRGPPPTRHHPNPSPKKTQQIRITGPDNPTVTGGPLTIPFSQLLLRNPSPPETDFVFTREDLLDLAEEAWVGMRKLGHLP